MKIRAILLLGLFFAVLGFSIASASVFANTSEENPKAKNNMFSKLSKKAH